MESPNGMTRTPPLDSALAVLIVSTVAAIAVAAAQATARRRAVRAMVVPPRPGQHGGRDSSIATVVCEYAGERAKVSGQPLEAGGGPGVVCDVGRLGHPVGGIGLRVGCSSGILTA